MQRLMITVRQPFPKCEVILHLQMNDISQRIV